jgi:small-conductance mechanosensitive channel
MAAVTPLPLFDLQPWGDLAWTMLVLAGAVVLAAAVHALVFRAIKRIAAKTPYLSESEVAVHFYRPSRLLLVILAVYLAQPLLDLSKGQDRTFDQILSIGLIAVTAWSAVKLTYILAEAAARRFDSADSYRSRRVITQIRVFRRFLFALILVVALASILMAFDSFRKLGTSILASAGVAGIIVGFASQRALSLVVSGLQIAVAQPIRIGESVTVEGEFCTVEEITFTFVMLRVWDGRGLILPISYFTEKPFQNWSRVRGGFLGAVVLPVDFSTPVDKVREELERILATSDKWDRRTGSLQVVSAGPQTMELRALVSAADQDALWSLRCEVRERLVAFLQRDYPDSLPRTRTEPKPNDPAGQVD